MLGANELPLRQTACTTLVRRKSAASQKAGWVHFRNRSQDLKISRLESNFTKTALFA